jgi:hypothetical protein
VSKRTLAIGAEYCIPYSRRILDALAKCIPASRLVVIPRVTLVVSYQEPAVFNEAVLDFLAQCR